MWLNNERLPQRLYLMFTCAQKPHFLRVVGSNVNGRYYFEELTFRLFKGRQNSEECIQLLGSECSAQVNKSARSSTMLVRGNLSRLSGWGLIQCPSKAASGFPTFHLLTAIQVTAHVPPNCVVSCLYTRPSTTWELCRRKSQCQTAGCAQPRFSSRPKHPHFRRLPLVSWAPVDNW